MISGEHEDHLDELRSPRRETALEPQERDDATDEPQERGDATETGVLLENVGDARASVQKLPTALVGDGRDERGRLADETELMGLLVVRGGDGRLALEPGTTLPAETRHS